MNSSERLTQEQSSTGLKVALRIINAWQATPAQACSILRISSSTYRRALKGRVVGRRLDLDQQQRIGLVLGIHVSLRTVFTNQANVRGFPAFKNGNPFFEDRSPVEVMAQGDLISIYETFKRIKHLEWLA
ncbi:MAG: antitoxin Xre-like helix-turn-helix domain-containing protein [Pseudomonas palmensis]|uniref:antitoxin Xre-like helix-turn-helix domain-containing protein n=1 Tax=Pseudomonas palmensis TaxID=2815362 RepID=UPI003D0A4585